MLQNILKLEGITILTKTEQNTVIAGTGTGTCSAFIPCTIPGDHDDSCGGGQYTHNVSKKEAKAFVVNGGRWCCEGCSTASWMH